MKYILTFGTILIVFFGTCCSQQYSKSWADLNYAGDNKECHRMDIFTAELNKR